jgi:hypothetical protein
MQWIVTFRSDTSPADIEATLRQAGAVRLPSHEDVPLGSKKIAVNVEGPAELSARFKKSALVLGVFPSSEMTVY